MLICIMLFLKLNDLLCFAALCFLLFLLGVPMTTQGGAYIFQVFYVAMSLKPQKKSYNKRYFLIIQTNMTNI